MKVVATGPAKNQLACRLLGHAHFLETDRAIFAFNWLPAASSLLTTSSVVPSRGFSESILHFLLCQWQSPLGSSFEKWLNCRLQFRGQEGTLPNSVVVLFKP